MVSCSGILARATTVLLVIASVKGQGDFVAVAGVQNGTNPTTGARPARQNINTLASSGAAWDLYIQALNAFQADQQSDKLSYYQISGIHGRPYAAWDNSHGSPNDWATGYCTHDSILFPIWHRPYLALYEKTLFGYVQNISNTYLGTNGATYRAAATTWRMPYWDWAQTPQMPATVTTPLLKITGPSGPITVSNPLYTYKFHPLSTADFPTDGGDAPTSIITAPTTYRDADSNGNSNQAYVNQQLAAAGLTQSTYNVFSRATTYPNFATQVNSGNSLESVHGTIHVTVGQQNGHMTYIPYSAFDPIFWLHHTNVDRLFAMWQAIYPSQYVTRQGQVNNYGTFTEAGGTVETLYTNLTPFTSNQAGTAYWNANTSQSLKTWGYTYPEIQDWNQTPAQLTASVTKSVNSLYNAGGATTSSRFSKSRFFARTAGSAQDTAWFANIAVDKQALGGPFKIFLFLGSPPTDSTKWATASNLIGVQGYFSPVAPAGSLPPQLTYSEINLEKAFKINPSSGLLGTLQSTGADIAIPFLSKYFQWGVQKVDGTVVPNDQIPSMKVSVQQEPVAYPTDATKFPKFGTPAVIPEITHGKAGGLSKFLSKVLHHS